MLLRHVAVVRLAELLVVLVPSAKEDNLDQEVWAQKASEIVQQLSKEMP